MSWRLKGGHWVRHGQALKEMSAWAFGKGFLTERDMMQNTTHFFGLLWLLCFPGLWQPSCTMRGYGSESRLCVQKEEQRGEEPESLRHHRTAEPAWTRPALVLQDTK